MAADQYKLEKAVWSTDDFDEMYWHDSTIHALGFTSKTDLSFDIDYICHAEENGPQEPFSLWVAPATLTFHNVDDFQIAIDFSRIIRPLGMEIDGINKPTFLKPWWNIYLHDQGEIKFKTSGFTQYFRAEPVMQTSGCFGLIERGGISFSKTPYK